MTWKRVLRPSLVEVFLPYLALGNKQFAENALHAVNVELRARKDQKKDHGISTTLNGRSSCR